MANPSGSVGGTNLTYAEMAKRIDGTGMVRDAANLLAESNEIIGDLFMQPSSEVMSHQSSIVVGQPTVSLRSFNQGVASTRSQTALITDTMSMLETRSIVDSELLATYGDANGIRSREAIPHIEAMSQAAAELIFYGSTGDDPKEFNGLTMRYDTASSDNFLDAGGTASNALSSVWLLGHKPNVVHGIYPKNMQAGLKHTDMGQQVIQTGTGVDGGTMDAFLDVFRFKLGLVIKDWRYVARIGNVDVSGDLTPITDKQALTGAYDTQLLYLMAKALHRIPRTSGVRPCFYMPRSIFEGLHVLALAQKNANVFTIEQVANSGPMVRYMGIPLKICDQLLYTEPQVV